MDLSTKSSTDIECYNTPELLSILEIKRTRLNMWLKNGWVKPSVYKAYMRGEKNLYSLLDVVVIQIFKQMIDDGFFRQIAGDLVERIKDTLKNDEYPEGWEDTTLKYIFFFKMDDGDIVTLPKNYYGGSGIDLTVAFAGRAKSVYGVNISEVIRKLKVKMMH